MIAADDAIRVARALIGTPYSELDCIGLIVRVIRTAQGGVPAYRTAGTNTLWASYGASARYRDLTWRQEGIQGARAGMLAFKRSGEDVHHVGLVTGEGTVIHSSSAAGQVVETALDGSWALLGIHRYIKAAAAAETEGQMDVLYRAVVNTLRDPLNVRDSPDAGGRKIGELARGTTVDVLAEPCEGWLYVRSADGVTGYAAAAYLAEVVYLAQSEDDEEENAIPVSAGVTIIDDEGNRFKPVGGWRVLIGGVD